MELDCSRFTLFISFTHQNVLIVSTIWNYSSQAFSVYLSKVVIFFNFNFFYQKLTSICFYFRKNSLLYHIIKFISVSYICFVFRISSNKIKRSSGDNLTFTRKSVEILTISNSFLRGIMTCFWKRIFFASLFETKKLSWNVNKRSFLIVASCIVYSFYFENVNCIYSCIFCG